MGDRSPRLRCPSLHLRSARFRKGPEEVREALKNPFQDPSPEPEELLELPGNNLARPIGSSHHQAEAVGHDQDYHGGGEKGIHGVHLLIW